MFNLIRTSVVIILPILFFLSNRHVSNITHTCSHDKQAVTMATARDAEKMQNCIISV